jgi:hypothetical protein
MRGDAASEPQTRSDGAMPEDSLCVPAGTHSRAAGDDACWIATDSCYVGLVLPQGVRSPASIRRTSRSNCGVDRAASHIGSVGSQMRDGEGVRRAL